MKNYYRVLGVNPDADEETIERVYTRLTRRLENDPSNEAKARLRNVAEAYEVLADPTARADHDRKLAGGAGQRDAATSSSNRALLLAVAVAIVVVAAVIAGIVIAIATTGDDGASVSNPDADGTPANLTPPPQPTIDPNVTPGPDAPPDIDAEATVLDSGVQVFDVNRGTGADVTSSTTVVVHYTGWLEDGTKFDSSRDRAQPFTVILGQDPAQVIQGWEEGLPGMQVGGTRRLVIPPDLAYGEQGFGSTIPPNATLTFDIEVLEVQ